MAVGPRVRGLELRRPSQVVWGVSRGSSGLYKDFVCRV